MKSFKVVVYFSFVVLFLGNSANAQDYQNGYVILRNNEKREGYILNKDWKDNPTSIKFKSAQDSDIQTLGLREITEFSILGSKKYVAATLPIDTSGVKSAQRKPEWKQLSVFLLVLVESQKATLYSYKNTSFKRYFFKTESRDVEQLIYKNYLLPDKNNVHTFYKAQNTDYLVQLSTHLKCGEGKISVGYNPQDLINYFNEYITCSGGTITQVEKTTKVKTRLSLTLGMELSDMYTRDKFISTTANLEYNNIKSFKPGVEIQWLLPFKNYKWSFLLNPSYKSFSASAEDGSTFGKIEYSAVEIPFGLGYSFKPNKGLNASIRMYGVQDFDFNASFDNNLGAGGPVSISPRPRFCAGLALEFRRISMEARYYSPSNFINAVGWKNSYQALSFQAGFLLVK